MIRNTKQKELLGSLSKYYISFVVILFTVFMVSHLMLGYMISTSNDKIVNPLYNFYKGNIDLSSVEDFNRVTSINGYVEILNSNNIVIKTYGQVPLNKTKSIYSIDEIYNELSLNNEGQYNTFINTVFEGNSKYKILTRIPKKRVSLEFKMIGLPYKYGKHYYHLYFKVYVSIIFLSIIIIFIYSIWTTRKIKKPLEEIDKSLMDIVNGDYNTRLDLYGEVEFEIVRDTINFLIDKLKASEEENKKLTESKNRMMLDLSHDIKTPITTIQGFSAALSGGLIESDEKRENYYKTIYDKSKRVAELVDDLFYFAQLQENKYVLKLEKVDLSEFLRQIILEFIEELDNKGIDLEVNIPEESIFYSIDSKLFKRVIYNIIENAIKYNESGTRLRIELMKKGEGIVIEVADNGMGIPCELCDKIFEPFVRGDKSRKSDGGTGLGLSIAKKIVESHGGSIRLIRGDIEKTIFIIEI